ncbi:cardiolipin synthase [Acetatifactor aquisgranensis]|uniref:cardiolipin synthase n=1 Tax=Acetatifactor aquisgranensis TaxID=2941233 RepID=UPI00203E763B|nr:cardiolipin synthase [Acetatifactor aquisgranensis]
MEKRKNDNDNMGIRLLKKGQNGIIHAVFSRMGLFLLLMLLQIGFLVSVYQWFREFRPHIFSGTILFTVIMVLYLLNCRRDATAKITWLIVVMFAPVFGSLLYLYTQKDIGHRALKARFGQIIAATKKSIPQSETVLQNLAREDAGAASLVHYIQRSGCHPVYDRTKVTYFPLGEDKFAEMLRQLEKAEHFIFLEYFIIAEGLMWGEILEILIRKAGEGVDVRLMYDGTCEFALLPHKYLKLLRAQGIQCKVFAPVSPFISTHYNYRDHRKILVIDGHTAFNGGINLADEYINQVERFGHWKDTAVMVQGEAAKSFTLLFLQMWNIDVREPEFDKFLAFPAFFGEQEKGYVVPYGDWPLDDDKLGERVYMDILNRAVKYVHIMTPYLILDGEIETALKFSAERGVEVALILPGIPDKRIPYALAKTHYASLLESGVKIYEYTPGFVHAKVFVSDTKEAVVGTINLDYRSLYHHFECATYMHGTDCIPDIEADFQAMLPKCRQVTRETIREEKWTVKLLGVLMKVAAPLL